MIRFFLTDHAIDITALQQELHDEAAGAEVIFDGRVRNHNDGHQVKALAYQAYAGLAIKVGQKILEEEAARFSVLRVIAVHRTGELAIGDSAVWVGVATAHRNAAYEASRAIMERIKYELPMWKKETYADGSTEWVGPDNTSAATGMVDDTLPEWRAKLEEIWISPGHDFRGHHGQPRGENGAISVEEIDCVAGMGLRGDRYFGFKPDFKGQVTFFDQAAVDAVRKDFSCGNLCSSVFRRNVIVSGVDLSAWVGKKFRFQGIEFQGSEECKPCYWMDEAVAPGVEEFLKARFRGGLRARILTDGVLRLG